MAAGDRWRMPGAHEAIELTGSTRHALRLSLALVAAFAFYFSFVTLFIYRCLRLHKRSHRLKGNLEINVHAIRNSSLNAP